MYSGKNFNKNKDELVQRIYVLMNETVFNNKVEALTGSLPRAGCCEVCRCTGGVFSALDMCQCRWGEMCMWERNNICGLEYMAQTGTTTGEQQMEKSPRACAGRK